MSKVIRVNVLETCLILFVEMFSENQAQKRDDKKRKNTVY